METIAHALCGACIADTGFSDRIGRKPALWVGVLAANAPDLDIALLATHGADHYMLWHQGATHGLLACALAPPAIAAGARLFTKAPRFRDVWLLAFLAYVSHVALDVVTSWGTMVLSPFDHTRFAAHWVYVVDLFFWVILTLPLWVGRVVDVPRARVATIALLLLGAYVGLCGVLRGVAIGEVAAAAERRGLQGAAVTAYPAPFLPLLWNGVADDGRLLYQGRVQLLGGAETALDRAWPRNLDSPLTRAVAQTDLGARFLDWWSVSPVADPRCAAEARWVVLRDLRFEDAWSGATGMALAFRLVPRTGSAGYDVMDHTWITRWTGAELPEAGCPDLRTSTSP